MISIEKTATTASSENLCQMCKTRPARDGGFLCLQCMGLERALELGAKDMNPTPTESLLRICPSCGLSHPGIRIGKYLSNFCRECLNAKWRATYRQNRHMGKGGLKPSPSKTSERKKKSMPTEQQPEVVPPEQQHEPLISHPITEIRLQLDFTEFPELLDKLRTLAREQMRTPTAQILWMIKTCYDPVEKCE